VLWGKVKEGRSGVGRHGGAAVEADEPRGEARSGGLNEGLLRVEKGRDGVAATVGGEAGHRHLVHAAVVAEAWGRGRRGDELGHQLVWVALLGDHPQDFADAHPAVAAGVGFRIRLAICRILARCRRGRGLGSRLGYLSPWSG
jgi:hypothetical protein